MQNCDSYTSYLFNKLNVDRELPTQPASYRGLNMISQNGEHLPSLQQDMSIHVKLEATHSSNSMDEQPMRVSSAGVSRSPPHICLVCGDISSGIHYGVQTCEGCKSFFKRSLQGKGQTFVCAADNKCQVDKRLRRNCAACRLRICHQVGMKSSGARKRRHDQTATQQQSLPNKFSSVNTGSKATPLTKSKRAASAPELTANRADVHGPLISPTSSENGSQTFFPSEELNTTAFNLDKYTQLESAVGLYESALCMLIQAELPSTINWARATPGFSELSVHDQISAIESKCLQLISLAIVSRSAARHDSNLHFIIEEKEISTVINQKDQIENDRLGTIGRIISSPLKLQSKKTIQALYGASQCFSELDLSIQELSLLKSVLLSLNLKSQNGTKQLREFEQRIRQLMEDHCVASYGFITGSRRVQDLYLGLQYISNVASMLECCMNLQAELSNNIRLLTVSEQVSI